MHIRFELILPPTGQRDSFVMRIYPLIIPVTGKESCKIPDIIALMTTLHIFNERPAAI